MKKFLNLTVILAALSTALFFSSCSSDDDDDVQPTMTVTQTNDADGNYVFKVDARAGNSDLSSLTIMNGTAYAVDMDGNVWDALNSDNHKGGKLNTNAYVQTITFTKAAATKEFVFTLKDKDDVVVTVKKTAQEAENPTPTPTVTIKTTNNVKIFCTTADGSGNSCAASIDGSLITPKAASAAQQQKCDFVYYYGKMYSPNNINDAATFTGFSGWTTKNVTTFKVLSGVDFSTITAENIEETAGTPADVNATVADGTVVAFKTAAGKVGVFKVSGYKAGYTGNDYCTIDIKVVE